MREHGKRVSLAKKVDADGDRFIQEIKKKTRSIGSLRTFKCNELYRISTFFTTLRILMEDFSNAG